MKFIKLSLVLLIFNSSYCQTIIKGYGSFNIVLSDERYDIEILDTIILHNLNKEVYRQLFSILNCYYKEGNIEHPNFLFIKQLNKNYHSFIVEKPPLNGTLSTPSSFLYFPIAVYDVNKQRVHILQKKKHILHRNRYRLVLDKCSLNPARHLRE
jgi:hypothetical protein